MQYIAFSAHRSCWNVCTALPLWMHYAQAIYHIAFGKTYKKQNIQYKKTKVQVIQDRYSTHLVTVKALTLQSREEGDGVWCTWSVEKAQPTCCWHSNINQPTCTWCDPSLTQNKVVCSWTDHPWLHTCVCMVYMFNHIFATLLWWDVCCVMWVGNVSYSKTFIHCSLH